MLALPARSTYISSRRRCVGADKRMSMVIDGIASAEGLWLRVRREAEAVVATDPVLGRSLSISVLDHPGLGSAVALQIGQRLGKATEDRAQFTRIANEAFQASPDLIESREPRPAGHRAARPGVKATAAAASEF